MTSSLPSKRKRFLRELQAALSSKESNLPPKWKRISRAVTIVLFLVILAGYCMMGIDGWYRDSAYGSPLPHGFEIGIIIAFTSITILAIYMVTVEYIFHKRRSLSSHPSEEPPPGE